MAGNAVGQVTVDLFQPSNGSVVSNTISLKANASSTAGNIVKVEFYRDGVLFATVYHPGSPSQLRVIKMLFRMSRTNNVSSRIWI